jgi:hypothetical protein
MATWNQLRRIAKKLPELEEQDQRQWRVNNKMVAWERPLRSSDLKALGDAAPKGDILGVRVADEGVKHALIADDPEVYFTSDFQELKTPFDASEADTVAGMAAIDAEGFMQADVQTSVQQTDREGDVAAVNEIVGTAAKPACGPRLPP